MPVDAGVPKHEPEETSTERMARLLKASGAAAGLLATDVTDILGKVNGALATSDSLGHDSFGGRRLSSSGTIRRLEQLAEEAREYSRRYSTGWDMNGDDNGDQDAVNCVEALGACIEEVLSSVYFNRNSNGTNTPRHETSTLDAPEESLESRIGIRRSSHCRDLRQSLEAALEAFLPVIGERTSLGGLRLAILDLKTRVNESVEVGWRQLHARVSSLDNDVSGFVKDHGSALEDRLAVKADVSWVQRELQRVWETLKPCVLSPRDPGDQADGSRNPKSAIPPHHAFHSSSDEGPALIKDLLRKMSCLEEQVHTFVFCEEGSSPHVIKSITALRVCRASSDAK